MKFQTTGPLGHILKSHGKHGELIISSEQQLPENMNKMESLFIEIQEKVVPFFIDGFIRKTPTTAILKLEDIDTLEEANGLIGLNWHLPSGQAGEQPGETTHDLNQLTGFTLLDQNDREIGPVEDVDDTTSNILLEVNYQGRLLDIPVHEETIYYINPEKRMIKLEIPEGLLDI
jgi:16S rRNA processing protein RimM